MDEEEEEFSEVLFAFRGLRQHGWPVPQVAVTLDALSGLFSSLDADLARWRFPMDPGIGR